MNLDIYTSICDKLSNVLYNLPITRYAISEFHGKVTERGDDHYRGVAKVIVEYNDEQHTHTFAWMSHQFQISVEEVQ